MTKIVPQMTHIISNLHQGVVDAILFDLVQDVSIASLVICLGSEEVY